MEIAILIIYVDDIILIGDNIIELVRLKKVLANDFKIKDLGTLKHFHSMEFSKSRKGIFVSQWKYVLNLLDETWLLGCKVT